jgi:L-fuculose-phosphate aldolase
MKAPFTIRKELTEASHRLAAGGLVVGTEGNLSVRLDDGRVMVTPSGINKGRLTIDDMVIVDEHGKKLQGGHQPSSELAMHLFVYNNRPDIKACVHGHPPYATAFAVAGVRLEDNILPEVALFVGKIPLVDYSPPGTPQTALALEPLIEKHSAFLLRNHGLLTIGRDLEEALNRHETVERLAQIVHLAHQLGSVNEIPSDDYRRLERLREKLDSQLNDKS